ncbi:hypothetical protein COOONC_22666, partial [Cooperia oncophora]
MFDFEPTSDAEDQSGSATSLQMSEDGPVTPRTPGALRPEEIMTDEDFVKAIEEMAEEAERILSDTGNSPVKSSLPEQTRPTEPDNDTDVEQCVQRLLDNDPTLKEVNMNNMKRTPIPQIRRLLEALAYNEHCERLSLANMGLYDNDVAVSNLFIDQLQTFE